jgi:hypothetical protein
MSVLEKVTCTTGDEESNNVTNSFKFLSNTIFLKKTTKQYLQKQNKKTYFSNNSLIITSGAKIDTNNPQPRNAATYKRTVKKKTAQNDVR